MKHRNRHAGGRSRHLFSPEGSEGYSEKFGRHGRGGGRRGSRHRLFDYGDMRLLVLGLIAEKPTYGYELIRTIEEKFGGSYTPSPGVIYPTLTWLEEAGYVSLDTVDGRKSFKLSGEGEAFLAANKSSLDEILARSLRGGEGRGEGRKNVPVSVMRAMENLRTALRLRLRNGGLDSASEEKVVAILDEAARALEQISS